MTSTSTWTFLTNHAIILVSVAERPRLTLREMSDTIGITERAVSRIVNDLAADGYVEIRKEGRRNVYQVNHEALLRREETRHVTVGELLALVLGPTALEADGSRPVEAVAS